MWYSWFVITGVGTHDMAAVVSYGWRMEFSSLLVLKTRRNRVETCYRVRVLAENAGMALLVKI